MKIAILGYGKQGRSAYEYWRRDNDITVCDKNEKLELPAGATAKLGDDYLSGLDEFDLIVRSPSVHPRDITAANSTEILGKVTSNTNEFFRACPSQNTIGVTGTKGKGTTSTLIARMLEAAGKRVHLGGNIATPPLDLLKDGIQPSDFVVLELANFQLIDLKCSPHIAVCLMVVPEHLDWHKDMDEYMAAKQQLFRWQTSEDIAIYYGKNEYSQRVAAVSKGRQLPYTKPPGAEIMGSSVVIGSTTICSLEDIQLLGKHNWQNVCAAVTTVWQVSQDAVAIQKTIRTFRGLPHRLEYVREVENVRYFNDSYASALDATIAALDAIEGSKVMIIGGFDRGLDLNGLASSCKQHESEIKKLVLIGASAPRIAEALKTHGFLNFEVFPTQQMAAIVKHVRSLATSGDSVVLSPGFPSFDMFKNFEDRGLQFKEAVNAL